MNWIIALIEAERPSETSPVRVTLEDVSLAIDGRQVFERLSLDLTPGHVGLIGRNGAGKSQLLRMIAGLVKPDSGQVRVDGFDPAKDRCRATASIGFVFQNPDHALLFPTVIEELSFGPKAQGATKAQAERVADDLLARFGVPDWRDRLVHSLSQGQKHLLGLMAACANAPKLLILDEVFAGLDLPTSRSLRHILNGLGMARIEANHDLAALAGCDRVLRIAGGTVGDDGAADPVIARYMSEMEALPLAPGAL